MFRFLLLFLMPFWLFSQDSLVFNNIVNLSVNDVESQGKTGTCWSYATASFLESELIRLGKGKRATEKNSGSGQ